MNAESELTALAETEQPTFAALLKPVLADVGVVLAWFVVAGLIGALVWWQVTPLAEYTRSGAKATLDEEQLSVEVASDGWFFVVAAVGGLLSGVSLLSWRRRDPVVMVILVAAGGVLATFLMIKAGLVLGPSDPQEMFASAKEGAKIPLQLKIRSDGLWVVWSVTALLGAVGVIWGTDHHHER